MSSLSFLSVYLSGASVILLLTVSQAQDYDFTPAPDYDTDYNATFDYSFYSNTSSEDLEKFSERFIDQGEEEDTGGWREEEGVTVTTATTRVTTGRGDVDVHNATSLPVTLEIRTLVWTLMILISLNLQQLQHTL
ncbi:uncharacterized protein si:ch211-191i18.2 [Seriola aureovittata]|uniref:uncharacterized protein si:ch211-191i18.2 n=1 Tax=Seriola aureovittata TaxID=2871759 RepID=UPI0024BEFD53|nr:uncharacterized protein si:ch211-191i18.2 [Seriola aureovittata]